MACDEVGTNGFVPVSEIGNLGSITYSTISGFEALDGHTFHFRFISCSAGLDDIGAPSKTDRDASVQVTGNR